MTYLSITSSLPHRPSNDHHFMTKYAGEECTIMCVIYNGLHTLQTGGVNSVRRIGGWTARRIGVNIGGLQDRCKFQYAHTPNPHKPTNRACKFDPDSRIERIEGYVDDVGVNFMKDRDVYSQYSENK